MSATHRLGILLSGRGSNFAALADAIAGDQIPDTEVAVVLSNRAEAPGLALAQERGIPAIAVPPSGRSRESHDAALVELLQHHGVTLVCLAGYLRLLSPAFIRAFPQRILNIHPSLLPAFPGLDAQAQAIRYGVRQSGCTVHFVDEELDHGVIVAQVSVPVLPTDDEAALAARILRQEHQLYPQAVLEVVSGGWRIEGRRFLPAPLLPADARTPEPS